MKITSMPSSPATTRWELTIREADLINGWKFTNPAVTMQLIREGMRVELIVPSLTLNGIEATADWFFIPPPGYSPSRYGNYGNLGILGESTSGVAVIRKNYTGGLRTIGTSSRSSSISGAVFWYTSDPQPVA